VRVCCVLNTVLIIPSQSHVIQPYQLPVVHVLLDRTQNHRACSASCDHSHLSVQCNHYPRSLLLLLMISVVVMFCTDPHSPRFESFLLLQSLMHLKTGTTVLLSLTGTCFNVTDDCRIETKESKQHLLSYLYL
jgi:hypothetical protein